MPELERQMGIVLTNIYQEATVLFTRYMVRTGTTLIAGSLLLPALLAR